MQAPVLSRAAASDAPGAATSRSGGRRGRLGLGWLAVLGLVVRAGAAPFVITVVDDATGRGVPLVELSTVHHVRYWTDNAGLVAFEEPGLTGREVFFHVRSDGYEYPKDGFGYRGLKLTPTQGGEATIRLRRTNVAERLYRITGEGRYRDTVLAGRRAPVREPILNGLVTGQDTVIATPYRGRIHWFWGDTDRLAYPLGNFGAAGATSALPGPGGLDPAVGMDLEYFVDATGFARPMCPEPDHGLRWIEGVMVVPDRTGRERLVARMAHHKDLGKSLGEYLLQFNDEKGHFEILERWNRGEGHDSSHPFRARVDGREYLYLYPNWRVPADLESLRDLGRYEAWTCVGGEGRVPDPIEPGSPPEIDRDGRGVARYSWKAGADRLHPGRVRALLRAGSLQAGDIWTHLRDVETGEAFECGRGSVSWNRYRDRWVMIVARKAGEVWFAEADTPTGPWVYARRVVSHEAYNFYNPVHHAFLDQEQGRRIYFEGTYTAAFSAAREKTPRYEYNQILYRLALDDPRLALPAPVYRYRRGDGSTQLGMRKQVVEGPGWGAVEEIAFFALPPGAGDSAGVPVYEVDCGDGQALSPAAPASEGAGPSPLFRAMREGDGDGSGSGFRRELVCFRQSDGRRVFGLAGAALGPGFTVEETLPCRAWASPSPVRMWDGGARP